MAKSKRRTIKPRNTLHDHPLLRKCDVHEKTHKQKRGNEKVKVKREYFDQSRFKESILMNVFASVVRRSIATR